VHATLTRSLVLLLTLASAVIASAQPRLWFVDNARPNGDGSQSAPFATIGAAIAAAAAGDVIYVHRGTTPYREQVQLGERQMLAGHGLDISATLKERGIALPAGLPDLHAAPVLEGGEGDALTLASGSVVAGLRVRTSSGRSLVATSVQGDVAVRDTILETASGIAVFIDGGNAKLDVARSPITATTGAALAVRNRTGGTLSFHDGSTITVSAGARDAFVLENNQSEATFADAVRVTTNGARALVIRNSARVALSSQDSTVATTKATAIDIANTTIAIFLRSATVDGAGGEVKYGIALESAPGTFRIAGGSVRNVSARGISIVKSSGVTLQNLVLEDNATAAKATPPCATLTSDKTLDCAAAIYLAAATDVSISKTKIDDTGHTAIFGDGVANLTLDGVTIEDAGDEPGEHGIAIRNLSGRSVLFDSTIKDSSSRQLYIANQSGEGTLEIRKTRFDGGPPPAGQQGVLVELQGEGKTSLIVEDSDFVEHFSDGIAVVAGGKSHLEAFVHNSRFASTGAAVSLLVDGDARLDYRVNNNTIRNASANAIVLHTRTTNGSASGTIAENTIAGAKCGSCSGIAVTASKGGKLATVVRANNVRQTDGYGISISARGTSSVSAAVTGNTIADPSGPDVLGAIALQAGALKADTARLCTDVSANRITGAWPILVSSRGGGTVALKGMPASATDAAAVQQFVRGKNNDAAAKVSGATAAATSCQ
jgi:hypothetical protein